MSLVESDTCSRLTVDPRITVPQISFPVSIGAPRGAAALALWLRGWHFPLTNLVNSAIVWLLGWPAGLLG